ncbi:hypothetical protein HNV12_02250 [Methanococcoides sp. SA1]|nr:hypothetical protein [Methanococcoides sp. SA1]
MKGEFRIRASDLGAVEWKGKRWVKSGVKFPGAVAVAKLFRKHGKLGLISEDGFLFGSLIDGKIRGKRIGVLPDGTKLDKAFGLFAEDLVVHDEKSGEHWDVLFRNPSGSFCYVYSCDKVLRHARSKFERVAEFEKVLSKLRRNLLRNADDVVALAILVLLETKIRVGSEVYYKRNHHKGLSTLKRKNLKIKGDKVVFDFVGKDGVPQVFEKKFSARVMKELRKVLKGKGADEFVFLKNGKVLRDSDFEAGFERWSGVRFYPHIVRSAFATRETERFLAKGKIDRDLVREFYLGLAGELGHKKFSKRKGEWENCYEVTLHHYVRPDLVERVSKLIG